MNRSEDIKELAAALAAFQAEMPEIKLDKNVKVTTKTGGAYNFQYATLANIIRTAYPCLAKHGLSIAQTFRDNSLVTTLFHTSGEYIQSIIPIDFTGNMQEIGSRISYLKRYSISALVGVVGDEDDDANIAAGNSFRKSEPATKAKPEPEKKKSIKKELPTQTHKIAWSNLLKVYNKDTERIKLAIESITGKESLFDCNEEEAGRLITALSAVMSDMEEEEYYGETRL